jgi:hypothetical protein
MPCSKGRSVSVSALFHGTQLFRWLRNPCGGIFAMNVNSRKRPIAAILPTNLLFPSWSQQLGDWSGQHWESRKFGRRDRLLGPDRQVGLSLNVDLTYQVKVWCDVGWYAPPIVASTFQAARHSDAKLRTRETIFLSFRGDGSGSIHLLSGQKPTTRHPPAEAPASRNTSCRILPVITLDPVCGDATSA